MTTTALGPLIHSFVEDFLKVRKALRPASIRSYRDVLRLFLNFAAEDAQRRITQLSVSDLTFERAQRFLRYLEETRGNRSRTCNHRLAVLRKLFEYLTGVAPEINGASEKIASIRLRRTSTELPGHLVRDEIVRLFRALPSEGKHALRDAALILFLFDTGASAQEASETLVGQIDLGAKPRAHMRERGGEPRVCPLWAETSAILARLLAERESDRPEEPVFCSRDGVALTRYGIYKVLRRHAGSRLDADARPGVRRRESRAGGADHRLDPVAGAVVRSWLARVAPPGALRPSKASGSGRVASQEIDRLPPAGRAEPPAERPVWKDDESLLGWLNSL